MAKQGLAPSSPKQTDENYRRACVDLKDAGFRARSPAPAPQRLTLRRDGLHGLRAPAAVLSVPFGTRRRRRSAASARVIRVLRLAVEFKDTIEVIGKAIDALGVAVVVAGILFTTVVFVLRLRAGSDGGESAYREYRQGIGRAILLGLEFLVAADIIRTVAVSPTFRSAGVLAIIVLIRTFLSMSLQLELEGRWPWQRASASNN